MWYLISSLFILWFIYSSAVWLKDKRKGKSSYLKDKQLATSNECCGKHSECSQNFLVKPKVSKIIDYYNDEELDIYKNVSENDYSENTLDEFREVLYSLKKNEVSGWLLSLQQREIIIPQTIRDEAMFIITDQISIIKT